MLCCRIAAQAPYPAYGNSACEPDGVALSGYPAFNAISLFQRVGQRDDMQGVGIIANAEDAFGL